MPGMNPDPMKSYSLADRLVCDKCRVSPRILSADGSDPVAIRYACHGETGQGVFSKSELVFTQVVFPQPESAA